MSESELQPTSVVPAGHQSEVLELLGHLEPGERLQLACADRLANGDQLEQVLFTG